MLMMCFAVVAEAYQHIKLMRKGVHVQDAYMPSMERTQQVA